MRPRRLAPALLTIASLAVGGGCGDASGCGDFDPKSDRIDEGETVDVTVSVRSGGLGQLDVADMYWSSEDAVSLPDGEYPAKATLTKSGGGAAFGILTVDLGDAGTVVYTGPITCE